MSGLPPKANIAERDRHVPALMHPHAPVHWNRASNRSLARRHHQTKQASCSSTHRGGEKRRSGITKIRREVGSKYFSFRSKKPYWRRPLTLGRPLTLPRSAAPIKIPMPSATPIVTRGRPSTSPVIRCSASLPYLAPRSSACLPRRPAWSPATWRPWRKRSIMSLRTVEMASPIWSVAPAAAADVRRPAIRPTFPSSSRQRPDAVESP